MSIKFDEKFKDAVVGVGSRYGQPDAVVYDYSKYVQILAEKDNMTLDEAVDFIEYNVCSIYIGDDTPIFLYEIMEDD